MSSETKFTCNFCREEIVPTEHSEGLQGWCVEKGIDTRDANYNLHWKINGPHICNKCVQAILDNEASPWELEK